jgi:hypothetical protein
MIFEQFIPENPYFRMASAAGASILAIGLTLSACSSGSGHETSPTAPATPTAASPSASPSADPTLQADRAGNTDTGAQRDRAMNIVWDMESKIDYSGPKYTADSFAGPIRESRQQIKLTSNPRVRGIALRNLDAEAASELVSQAYNIYDSQENAALEAGLDELKDKKLHRQAEHVADTYQASQALYEGKTRLGKALLRSVEDKKLHKLASGDMNSGQGRRHDLWYTLEEKAGDAASNVDDRTVGTRQALYTGSNEQAKSINDQIKQFQTARQKDRQAR